MGTTANVLTSQSYVSSFFETCQFDLETANVLDFSVSWQHVAYVNETVVIECTSNRKMNFGYTWANRTEMTSIKEITIDANKNEMRVETLPTEPEEDPDQQVQTFSSLSEALGSLQPSPMTNIITFSDGPFAETGVLSVSHLVEIVGAGSNLTDSHSTQLATDGIVSKSTGKLTLQSLRLVPLLSSSFLASTADSGSVCVLNVIVEEVSGITSSLFQLAAGACEMRHSFFKNISSEKSLICLSGTSSLAISNTLFLSIKRTNLILTSVETTQCASCIDGKTSGTVKLLYCRFGACTTNGRAGAIDLEKRDVNSAVEMGSCYFDQNSAGTQVASSVKGDDVVLMSFDESKISLDLSTIQSFPSLSSFLINSEHPIIPPPALLHITSTGIDDPLTWSYTYKRISDSLLKNHTLQYLLECRLRNNSKTEIKTYFGYHETMTPFIFQNSTVSVSLHAYSFSHLTVNQQNQVFITLEKAFLSFNGVRFVFNELTTPAFKCDADSSITLTNTAFKLSNPTLTQPFIDSVGPSVNVDSQYFLQPITLDNTPFVRLIRGRKDASFYYEMTTPLLASPLTVPFIVCEGASSASFASVKDSTINLYFNQIQLLKSTADGTFINLVNGTLKFQQDSCSSSSGKHGGLTYCQNATVTTNSLTLSSCSAINGGALFSQDCSVTMTGGSFSNCQADEGGVAYLVSSSLSISDTSFISNSAKRGGVFCVDFGNDFISLFSSTAQFTANSAVDVGEDGVDCGKGGAIFLKGTTRSETPLNLNRSRFDENTAAFGNDVYVEETVLGETGPDRLSNCYGLSNSRFPHLEIENHNLDDDELFSISNFLPFPTLYVSSSGKDLPDCKWSSPHCLTINYALPFLQTTFPNGTLFQRRCIQTNTSMTTEPVELKKNDLFYIGDSPSVTVPYSLILSVVDGVVFTITDESRLIVERIKFTLTPLHQVVNVMSKDGQFAMENCFVLTESETTISKSAIWSVGNSLILNVVSFASAVSSSIATLSAPLVLFSSTPSDGDELGCGSCDITNCSLMDFHFEGITMFHIETSGRVSFLLKSIYRVTTDSEQGKYISLKGQSFKQQIQPSLWPSNPTIADLPNYVGEDVSMDENDKWRTGSLVYWLVSPSDEILIGSVVNAVDHPNCGSSTFKCSTLDSAFGSAGLNELITLSLLTSMSLSSKLRATSSLLVQSSSAPKREIEFDEDGWFEVVNSGTNLTFASIVFTVSETCQSATLFVVEEGELSFSLCSMGGTNRESAVFLHETTAVFTHCTFSSLSNPQNGGAIHAELSSSNFLRITSCSFESCSSNGSGGSVSVVVAGGELEISSSNFTSSSSEQNGGALFVDLSSLGAGSYKLTSLTFASSSTSSGLGMWVYLVGRSLSTLVTQERWLNSYGSLDPSADQNKLWGLDLAESESSPLRSVSLLPFLLGNASRIPQSTVFVGQSGKDHFGCGDTQTTMCRTVEWGLTEATGSVADIVVVSNGLLSSPIILSNSDVQIASASGKLCPIVVSLENPPSAPTSMIKVERNSALALSFLSFSFSLPSSINSIIVSSSGVVNMDSCVVQKATLSRPFVVSSQSSHTISNTSFLSSTFKSSAFVLSNCPSLSIENTRIADNTFDTSFIAGSFSQIFLTSITVSNCTLKQDTSLFALSILPKTTSEGQPSFHISLSSFASSQSTPTPLFVSVASECALNVILVNTTFSHSTSSQLRKPAVVVTWTQRQPLLLRRRVVCEDCFVMVSQSQ